MYDYICNNLAIKESGLSSDSIWLIQFLNNRIKELLGRKRLITENLLSWDPLHWAKKGNKKGPKVII